MRRILIAAILLAAASVIRIATLLSASRNRRSRIMRLVTLVPSRPAKGLSLTAKRIDKVGGSIGCAWIGVVTEVSAIVSATVATAKPARLMISPARASSTGTRSSPWKVISLEARPVSTTFPSELSAWIGWLSLTTPELTRPVRMRPTNPQRAMTPGSL